ncbi:MAG: hypothetical protein GX442_25230 [Candidatus Riflebacteria bacterium]|nr:hypothetical protein [Candidatus Riflebacteria bacterium]
MLRTFATVLLILASLVGFVFSYEYAYHKISRVLTSSTDQVDQGAWAVKK